MDTNNKKGEGLESVIEKKYHLSNRDIDQKRNNKQKKKLSCKTYHSQIQIQKCNSNNAWCAFVCVFLNNTMCVLYIYVC